MAASPRFVVASSELWRLMAGAGNIQRLRRGLPAACCLCLCLGSCMHGNMAWRRPCSPLLLLLPLYAFAFNRCDRQHSLASLSLPLPMVLLLLPVPAGLCLVVALALGTDGWRRRMDGSSSQPTGRVLLLSCPAFCPVRLPTPSPSPRALLVDL